MKWIGEGRQAGRTEGRKDIRTEGEKEGKKVKSSTMNIWMQVDIRIYLPFKHFVPED